MRKYLEFIIFSMLLLLGASVCHAQNMTTVTGTITDTSSVTWTNAGWTAQLYNPLGLPAVFINTGQPVQLTYQGTANSSGAISTSLPNNAAISPPNTQWRFTFTGTVSHVSSETIPSVTIMGSSQNISTYISQNLAPLTVTREGIPAAYASSEMPICAASTIGTIYQMPDGSVIQTCSLVTGTYQWVTTGGSSGAGGSGNSVPLLIAPPTPLSTTGLQAYGNAQNQIVNIILPGDSFYVCSHLNCGLGGGPINPNNREPEVTRRFLQGINGALSNGGGSVPLIAGFAASPAPLNTGTWTLTSGSYDTNSSCLGPSQNGGTRNTLVHLTDGSVVTFSDPRNIIYNSGNVYFSTQSGSGTITVAVDGIIVGTASTTSFTNSGVVNAGCTARILTLPTFASSASHVVTFTSTGDTYLHTFQSVSGTTGISIHDVAVGGATTDSVGTNVAAKNAFVSLIPGGVQIVVPQFLTNDAASAIGTGTFQSNLTNIINYYQAMASAPSVILSIPPVDIVNGTDPEAPYTAIMTGLCSSVPLICLNIQTQGQTLNGVFYGFGTATPLSTNNWFDWTSAAWPTGNAGVHPGGTNDFGSIVEGQLLAGIIVNPPSSGTNLSALCSNVSGGLLCTSVNQDVATFQNSAANGPTIVLKGSGVNVDTLQIESASNSDTAGGKAYMVGDRSVGVFYIKQTTDNTGAGYTSFPSLNVLGWAPTFSVTANPPDAAYSRLGPNHTAAGNGTQGDSSGQFDFQTSSNGASGVTTFTSSNTSANAQRICSTATGIDCMTMVTDVFKNLLVGDSTAGLYYDKRHFTSGGNGYHTYNPGMVIGWNAANVSNNGTAPDTGCSRDTTPGVIDCGNGNLHDASGTINIAHLNSGVDIHSGGTGSTNVVCTQANALCQSTSLSRTGASFAPTAPITSIGCYVGTCGQGGGSILITPATTTTPNTDLGSITYTSGTAGAVCSVTQQLGQAAWAGVYINSTISTTSMELYATAALTSATQFSYECKP